MDKQTIIENVYNKENIRKVRTVNGENGSILVRVVFKNGEHEDLKYINGYLYKDGVIVVSDYIYYVVLNGGEIKEENVEYYLGKDPVIEELGVFEI